MTVLQALDQYYGRMERRGEVVAPGWSTQPIGIVLELDRDGTLLLPVLRWQTSRGKPRPERVPKWFSRSGTGSTPNFLWDNAAYVLGLGAKDPGKTARDHAAFKSLHLRELAAETDPGLVALRRFLEAWDPASGPPEGLDEKLLTASIAFRLRGDNELLHQRPAAAAHVERLRIEGDTGPEGFCLVLGERLPLVRLHPKIKGVDGGASAEIPLVSFNADAFTSYGKDQGFNAPTSEVAAFRYGAALDALLARGGPNRLRIGDATVAFWADASAYEAILAEAAARAAEDDFAANFDETPPPKGTTDAAQAEIMRAALAKAAEARAEKGVTPELVRDVPFQVLGLAPNAARISVRFWLESRFGRFRDALDSHADALEIAPKPIGWGAKAPTPSRLLLKTTALQEKFDNIPNGLAGDVTRAILAGTPYPRTWLAAMVTRLRAGDDPGRGWHAAGIKAVLTRTRGDEPVPKGLDPENKSDAYQLGRLFAVLESAQYAALGRVNASIADRYYGAASSTPSRVFAALMRGGKTHISDARKRGKGLWIEPRLQEIVARLPGDLPRTLRLEDQGRFAIGYYHERAFRPAKPDADTPDADHPDDQETK